MNADNSQRDLIYFDNAATTPVLSEVIQEMVPYLGNYYGNPSSQHSFGFKSLRAIEEARTHVSLPHRKQS